MRRKIYILIILQLAELFLIATIMVMLSGCNTINGLHSENVLRNAGVRWQQKVESSNHIVK